VEKIRPLCEEFIFIWGEILDHPEYLELVALSGKAKTGIPTTGIRLLEKPELAKELSQWGIGEVRISAHYFGQELNLPALDIGLVPEVIRLLKEFGIRAVVHTILWTGNYRKVADICQLAINDGADSIQFLNLMPTNEMLRKFTLSLGQRMEVFRQVEACRQKIPKEVLAFYLKGGFGPRPGSPGQKLAEQGRYCPAGSESVYINVRGEVYPCIYLTTEEFRLGNLDGQFHLTREPLRGFDRRGCYLFRDS